MLKCGTNYENICTENANCNIKSVTVLVLVETRILLFFG